jgi:hypothetical protein
MAICQIRFDCCIRRLFSPECRFFSMGLYHTPHAFGMETTNSISIVSGWRPLTESLGMIRNNALSDQALSRRIEHNTPNPDSRFESPEFCLCSSDCSLCTETSQISQRRTSHKGQLHADG